MLPYLSHSIWADRIGWVLVHSLWQFTFLSLIAAVMQRLLGRRDAATHYVALLAFMLLVVGLPVATWCMLGSSNVPTTMGKADSVERETLDSDFRQIGTGNMPLAELPTSLPSDRVTESHAAISSWRALMARIEPWLGQIVLIWIAGVVMFALRLALSLYTVRRLRTTGISPVASTVQEMLERVAKRLGLVQTVTVLQSTLVKTPLVIGFIRPLMLLPVCIVTGLPEAQLELLIAHELAHVRRHDYLVNLFQIVVETLFFYHPAVWWLSQQIRNERENCCDDMAMALATSRADYGRALLAVEELRAAFPTLSMAASGGSLLARIRRIAGQPTPSAAGGVGALALMLFSTAILAALAWGAEPTAEKTIGEKPTALNTATDGQRPKDSAVTPESKPSANANVRKEWQAATKTPAGHISLPAFHKLETPHVRKYLGISAEQEKKLREIENKYRPESRKFWAEYDKWKALPPRERELSGIDWGIKGEQARHSYYKPIADILTVEQRAIYQQEVRRDVIWIGRGNLGIELNKQQLQQMRELLREFEESELKRRRSVDEQLFAVLTPQQRQQLFAHFSDDEVVAPFIVVPSIMSGRPTREVKPSLDFGFTSGNLAMVIVYKELRKHVVTLSADQQAKLLAINAKAQTEARKLFERYQGKPMNGLADESWKALQDEYWPKRAKYKKELEQFGRDVIAQIDAVLQPQQVAAIRAAARNKKMIEELLNANAAFDAANHVTTEQRAKLKQIGTGYYSNGSTSAICPVPVEWCDKAAAILTPEQLKKVDEVIERFGW